MQYPIGYGEAEHRRALDALLADLAKHGTHDEPRRPPAPRPERRAQARVIGVTSASGHCQVELRMHPQPMLRP